MGSRQPYCDRERSPQLCHGLAKLLLLGQNIADTVMAERNVALDFRARGVIGSQPPPNGERSTVVGERGRQCPSRSQSIAQLVGGQREIPLEQGVGPIRSGQLLGDRERGSVSGDRLVDPALL